METMQNYTCYCTAEQTKRAHKLGAPISTDWRYNQDMSMVFPTDEDKQHFLDSGRYAYLYSTGESNSDKYVFGYIPTTQQMVGWLREKGVIVHTFACEYAKHYHGETDVIEDGFAACIYGDDKDDYNQAELAAIDAALDFLEGKL